MPTKVFFHSLDGERHCPDGFAAAWALWTVLGDSAEYIPCVHQQEPPLVERGDRIYLADFSYSRDVLEAWIPLARVTLLDHHKTAQAALDGLQEWSDELGLLADIVFHMEHSGAQLAWKYVQSLPRCTPPQMEPPLIAYVADRDLYRKRLPYTEEISRALSSLPQDFKIWNTLARLPNYVDFMRRIGQPLQKRHEQDVAEVAMSAVSKQLGDFQVLCTHTDRYSLVSDALNLVCKYNPQTPFALNYSEQGGRLKFELRSIGDFDVSAVALQFGGDGHRNAAGFSVDAATVGSDERLSAFWSKELN